MNADATDDLLAFDQGYDTGMHPCFDDPQSGGTTITTTLSRWLGLPCRTCRHTFRVGDRVHLDGGQVQHLDPALDCGTTPTATEEDGDSEGRDFGRGLLEAWPPASGEPVRLAATDWRIPRRDPGPPAPTCPVCAHTFRPGDMVIICPCARPTDTPDQPRCRLAVHRDPVSGLTCWDDWRPDGHLVRCPITREPPR